MIEHAAKEAATVFDVFGERWGSPNFLKISCDFWVFREIQSLARKMSLQQESESLRIREIFS
jgi:hypothetical protein